MLVVFKKFINLILSFCWLKHKFWHYPVTIEATVRTQNCIQAFHLWSRLIINPILHGWEGGILANLPIFYGKSFHKKRF